MIVAVLLLFVAVLFFFRPPSVDGHGNVIRHQNLDLDIRICFLRSNCKSFCERPLGIFCDCFSSGLIFHILSRDFPALAVMRCSDLSPVSRLQRSSSQMFENLFNPHFSTRQL